MDEMDVRIGEVQTDIVITEGVASLGPDDVKRIVETAMQKMRDEMDRAAQRQRDTGLRDSSYEAHT